jgi:hypothetical protein
MELLKRIISIKGMMAILKDWGRINWRTTKVAEK